MKNCYLHITKIDKDLIEVHSYDGVFTSFSTIPKEEYFNYCADKAYEWLTSDLGNYDGWSKKDRKEIAEKWRKAEYLSVGDYEYYFNFEDINDVFTQSVKDLAKKMGIENYNLTIN